MAKSTLYHHFEDKEQIYLSVLERDMLSFEAHIAAAAASESDCVERLRAVIKTYMNLLSDRGSVALNAIRRAGDLDRQLIDLFSRHRDNIFLPFVDIFQQGIVQGRFRPFPAELTTLSLLGMMNSFAAHRVLVECQSQEMEASAQEIADHTINLFLQGIVADEFKTSQAIESRFDS